ncbi:uncharacterized protein LOC119726452 isoform X34 [Patiria miniata]|uniref:HYR domain-containing protein n=1 Tax=Patiria miniata TaxID=46514 RepID=A0A913ZSD4_PATMI|nr:uncharacterized protein LOC119726452 isoform X34 [Patiria miniata]
MDKRHSALQEWRQNTLLVILTVVMATSHLSRVSGYPSGPPIDSYPELCSNMLPSGHSGSPSEPPSPYFVSFNETEYTPGQLLEVTLEAILPISDYFKGFLVIVDNTPRTIGPQGEFFNVSEGTQALDCSNSTQNAWGHSNNTIKHTVTAFWKPPAYDQGPLVARATVVKEFSVFWVHILSDVIQYSPPETMLTTTQPPSTDPTESSQATSTEYPFGETTLTSTQPPSTDTTDTPQATSTENPVGETMLTTTQPPSTDPTETPQATSTEPFGELAFSTELGVSIIFTDTPQPPSTSIAVDIPDIPDDEAPSITCPDHVTMETDAFESYATVTLPNFRNATDNVVINDTWIIALGAEYEIGSTAQFGYLNSPHTITYYAEDLAGNQANCSITITVLDLEPPDITCPQNGMTFVFTDEGQSFATVTLPTDHEVSDNVQVANVIVTGSPPPTQAPMRRLLTTGILYPGNETTFEYGSRSVYYIATDLAGNENFCELVVQVNDQEPPTIDCPFSGNLMQTTDEGQDFATVVFPSNYNASDNVHISSVRISEVDIEEFPQRRRLLQFPLYSPGDNQTYGIGNHSVYYIAADFDENEASCVLNIVVKDDEPPMIMCPFTANGTTDAGLPTGTAYFPDAIVTDNSGLSVGLVANASSLLFPFPIGETIVEFVATDSSGNSARCTFIVRITDDDPPMITCPANQTVATNSSLSTVTILLPPVSSASDNSGAYTITIDVAGATHNVGDHVTLDLATGQHLLRYIITDNAMNTETCDTYITVIDDEPPTIMCPFTANGTTDAGLPTGTAYFPDAIVTDNSGLFVGLVANASSLSTPFPIGETIVEFVATDSSGNSARCTFIVRITDDETPVLECPLNIVAPTDPGQDFATVTWNSPNVTDNSGELIFPTLSHVSGSTFPLGITTVEVNATDSSSNVASCSFIIDVGDDDPPMITCPANQTVATNSSLSTVTILLPPVSSASDNSGAYTITIDVAGATHSVGDNVTLDLATGQHLLLYIITDDAMNTETCDTYITVIDDEPPTIMCPFTANGTTDAGLPTGTAYFPDAIVTDNSGMFVGLVANASSLSTPFPIGETIVEFVATDSSGNSARCTFIVRITDDEAPELECPLNIVAPTNPGQDSATVTWNLPNVTDNSGELISPTLSHMSGSTFPLGITTVEVNATDSSSNLASCSFIIDVGDDDPPMITCPANQTVATNSSLSTVTILLPPVSSASDNSGAYTITIDVAGATHNVGDHVTLDLATGQHLLRYIITDNAMNTETCDTYITVIDDEPPMITCPFTANGTTDAGLPTGTAYFPDAIVTDNSGLFVGLLANASSLSTPFPIGETIVEFVATDSSGNSARCTFIVRITDDEPPMITCPFTANGTTAAGLPTGTAYFPDAIVTDNSGLSVGLVANASSLSTPFPTGETIVEFVATDSSGNSARCTFIVRITDDEAPVVECPLNIVAPTDPGQDFATVTWNSPNVTDNSGELISPTLSHVSGSTFPLGITTVEVNATDSSSNPASCSFIIDVGDDDPPMITCPANQTVATNSSLNTVTILLPPVSSASDNSGAYTITIDVAGTTHNVGDNVTLDLATGQHLLQYIITDNAMNTEFCDTYITVIDDEPPMIMCPFTANGTTDAGLPTGTAYFPDAIVTDNSGLFVGLVANASSLSTPFPIGETIVEFVATDSSGNSARCTFIVRITDDEAPVLECPMNIVAPTDPGQDFATVMWNSPNVTDNSGELISPTLSHVSGSTFPLGITTVDVNATDSSSNIGSCFFTIDVQDSQAPVVECPMNILTGTDTGQDFATVMWYAPNVTDNSGESITANLSHVSGSTFPLGITTVSVDATDSSGRTGSCSFTVTVLDDEAPVLECPMNIVAPTDPGQDFATVMWNSPNVTDNSGELISPTLSHVSGSTFPLGITTVDVNATDSSSNIGSCFFTIDVQDSQAPVVECPMNIVTGTDTGQDFATVMWYAPNVTDNSGESITANLSHVSGSTFPLGMTTVSVDATDSSGRSGSCSFTVTVLDGESPSITCPANQTVAMDSGKNFATVVLPSPASSSDNSGVYTVTIDVDKRFYFVNDTVSFDLAASPHLVLYTATDDAGNSATCDMYIIVFDDEAPVLECPMNIVAPTDPGQDFATVMWNSPNVTDNSGELISPTLSHVSGSTFPLGITTVDVNATDSSSNIGSCFFTIDVQDSQAPVVECPMNIVTGTDTGQDFATVMWYAPNVTDNSGESITANLSHVSGSTFPLGMTTVSVDATDSSGRTGSCSFTVTVLDGESPSITCPANQTVAMDSGKNFAAVVLPSPASSFDNSGVYTVTIDVDKRFYFVNDTVFFDIAASPHLVQYTATDDAGNSDTCDMYITVFDIDDCDPNPCLNGGTCSDGINSYTCTCAPGYTDSNCTTDIDDCFPDPCLNNGTCSDGVNGFTCECAEGFEGQNCSTNIDDCDPHPCLNGGTCSDALNGYTCTCAPGYTDINCSKEIDECSPNPCMNGGVCTDGINDYTCTCAPGYTDDNCTTDIDDCDPNPCLNGGTCSDGVDSYTCTCAPGYTDSNCTTDIDDCFPDPCLNNGTCSDGVNGFTCKCAEGFEGQNCSTNTDDCHAQACFNEGTCIDGINGYTCECVAGFEGDDCSTNIDDCEPDPCLNGGTCSDGVDSYTCTCAPGYTDSRCSSDVNECEDLSSCPPANRPCINSIGGFACTCPSGYEWNSTQCTDVDECLADDAPCPDTVPCQNTEGSFTCLCNQGFAWDGGSCSDVDECLDALCADTATCVNQPGGYSCVCPAGYLWNGTSCEDIDECEQESPVCPSTSPCQNTMGSYTCICSAGYAWNGTQCTDVDECQSSEPVCPSLASCTNTQGSFRCHCQDGYTLTGQPGSSLYFCMDIDECQDVALYDCHSNATCINEPGAYRCMCSETQGYRGDGTVCTPFDLCESGPCLNQGQCTSSVGSGSYECVCTEDFTGVNCGIRVVLQGPISVLKHPEPSLITASLYDTVTLECQFENANRFAWYRNGVVLPGTRDVSFLTIAGVTSTDRGYYWCEGSGLQGVTLQTNASLLLIDGVSAFTSEARFPTLTFVDELRNKSSPIFKQISAEIITFLSEGLQSEGVQANIAVKELNSGSVVATTEILTNAGGTNSDDSELLSIVQDALVGIATASDGYMDPSSITLESSGSCVETRWPTIYGTITLPAVPLGEDTVSNSDRVCPDYTINSGQPIAYAVCVGDGFSPAQWLVELQCGRNLTVDEKLALLNRVEVNDENVMVVALQVMALTEDAEMLSDAGVASTADIMTKIADVNSSTSQVTETVVDTVGNLMFISDEVLQEAEVRENAPSRIVRVLERQLGEVSLAGDVSFREVHPNIAVEVRGVTESTLLNGLGFASANSSSSGLFGESSLMVMEGEDELFQGASESEMPSAVLMLPPEVNILARREVGGGIRVSFSVFRKRNLFQSPSLADFNKGEDRFNRTINTRVMSATVGSQPITNLNEPVTILLSRLDNDSYVDNTSCVFWEFVNASWSSEGCRLREEYITDQYIACQCDHLTNFAALMDIYPESPLTETQEFILKLLSLVGCGMSILGLAVTMVTYLSHKKLRKTRPNRILLSLCASLLCLYITFVVATALDSERGVAELDVLPCCVLAGFLHYFTLTSLCWMGVEGFNMYLLFVRVVNVYVPKFMLKASLAAWGIPALIVAITAGATREDYVGTDFCFLKQIPLIAGLLAPIGLILLFNIVVFTLVIRQFIKTSNNDLRRNRDEMSKRKLHKQRLQNALTVMTLMGLTWSIGYLNLVQAISFPVQLVFCLLNTLQGYFIFMLYGVRRAEVRKHWRRCCVFQKATFSSVPTSSQTQSSTNKPQAQRPFNPNMIPRPPSQIYRHRPDSMMPSM